MGNLSEINKQVHDLVNNGADAVEKIHKSIANLPLDVAENIEFLSGPAKTIKEIQNTMIGGVYSIIKGVNDQVSEFANNIIEKSEK